MSRNLIILSIFLFTFIAIHIYVDFNYIINLIISDSFEIYLKENLFIFVITFIIFNTIYIFFLGLGSLSLIVSIILFNPFLALLVCVISKTLGSTLNIIFLQKVSFKSKIKFLNSNFLKKIKKYEFVNVLVLRLLPGFPVAVINSLISFLKYKISSQVFGSLIGFSISNGIFIFFLSNLKDIVIETAKGEAVDDYYIVVVLLFVLFLIFYNKLSKKIKRLYE